MSLAGTARSDAPAVRIDGIPPELAQQNQWVTWKHQPVAGQTKTTKVPYSVRGGHASTTDPSTWGSFDAALASLTTPGSSHDGIGFVVTHQDDWVGVDIDHCLASDGTPEPWAAEIVARLDSRTERTPSGDGLRVWARGKWAAQRHRVAVGRGAIEVYDHSRYFTVTGHQLGGTRAAIEPRQEALDWLAAQFFAPRVPAEPRAPVAPTSPRPGDYETLRLARTARNGDRFSALYDRGDLAGHDNDHSKADVALCAQLAFWTGADAARIDSLFRQSALMREKWDERRGSTTYGERTIDAALARVTDTYTPRPMDASPVYESDVDRWESGLDAADPQRTGSAHPLVVKSPQTNNTAIAYTLDELRTVQFRPRVALLCAGQDGILREGDIGQIYAPRGTGKSLLAGATGLAIAGGTSVLRWHAPEPRGVLLVDGEMPSDMVKQRLVHLAGLMGINGCPRFKVIGADWQPDYLPRLDTLEGQALVEPHITDDVALVILDNASVLFDPNGEKDPEAWAPAQSWLLSLRRRGKAVLMVHHANRQGGSRGHSKREDIMDIILKLSRPEGYSPDQGARFRVEFDKSRGFYGQAAESFEVGLAEDGWVVSGDIARGPSRKAVLRQRILEYLGAHPGSTKNSIAEGVTGRAQDVRNEVDDMSVEGILGKDEGKFSVR